MIIDSLDNQQPLETQNRIKKYINKYPELFTVISVAWRTLW
jgi:hypothetical protein